MIADQPLAPFGMKPGSVEGDDARRFLPPMLERVQAKRDNRRRVRVTEDAEDAAILVEPVFVWIDARTLMPI